jgi:hypothetical protein
MNFGLWNSRTKLSKELRGLQRNYFAYINRQVQPNTKDKEHSILIATVNSIAGYHDGMICQSQ